MNDKDIKKEFNETLSQVVEYAMKSGNIITKEDIHTYFKDLLDDEKMYDFIYKYLTDVKITVEGYVPPASAPEKKVEESNQALAFYEMYLDEMYARTENSSDIIPKLFHSFITGNLNAASPLSEQYLPLVVKISEEFDDMGITHSDLVAEGNLALYEAILDYSVPADKTADIKSFELYICSCIRNALKQAIDNEIGHHRISNHLVDQINALNTASTELAEELGREATLEELCERLSQGEDEIKELMKISINALSVIQTDED